MTIKVSNETFTTEKRSAYMEVQAMSFDHAKRIAAGIAGISIDHIFRVALIRKPRDAKTCSTEDFPVKGTRKWKTVYQVYAYGNSIPIGRNRIEHTQMELVQDDIETKTEAMKIAREMAIKHQVPMTVKIAQKLDTHDTTCANIVPKTGMGRFGVYYLLLE